MSALAILAAVVWWALWLRTTRARARMEDLDHLPAVPRERLPRLSVVIAAANEAEALPEALRSLLVQDHPDLEIVVVDDRSTDATPAILADFRDPRLRRLRIDRLPPGWLGKTHAHHQGGLQATGELILFTDADVVFEPGALSRACGALLAREADHLALAPTIEVRGFWETVFVSFFGLAFLTRFPAEKVSDPRHPTAVGIGAFNLVRAAAWRHLGGHEALRLQVVDDMVLATLLKRAGFRAMFARAPGWLRVRWVAGLGGILRGLEKNAYAGVEYSLVQAHLAALVLAVMCALPLVAPACGAGAAGLAALAAMGALGWTSGPGLGTARWAGLFYPLAGPLFALVLLRSAWLAEVRGAVVWRGTRYDLRELRREQVRI